MDIEKFRDKKLALVISTFVLGEDIKIYFGRLFVLDGMVLYCYNSKPYELHLLAEELLPKILPVPSSMKALLKDMDYMLLLSKTDGPEGDRLIEEALMRWNESPMHTVMVENDPPAEVLNLN
jgi:hypothetical protein